MARALCPRLKRQWHGKRATDGDPQTGIERKRELRSRDQEKEVIETNKSMNELSKSIIQITETARAVRDANTALLYYEGMVEDITERKRAEEELQKAKAAAESAANAIASGLGATG